MLKYKIVTKNRLSIAVSDFSDYVLHYQKGLIVKAKESTLGIFCFHERKHAVEYIEKSYTGPLKNGYKILDVLSIGDEIVPEKVADALTQNHVREFYQHFKGIEPPKGSVCCSSILVFS